MTDVAKQQDETQIILSSSGREAQNRYQNETHFILNSQAHNHSTTQNKSSENTQQTTSIETVQPARRSLDHSDTLTQTWTYSHIDLDY